MDESNAIIELFHMLTMGQGTTTMATTTTEMTTLTTTTSQGTTATSESDEMTTTTSTSVAISTINLDTWMEYFNSTSGESEETGDRPTTTTHPAIVIASTTEPTSPMPTSAPTARPTEGNWNCFTTSTYDAIDVDIMTLKNDIDDDGTRGHFLGGIVRLVAHDFMDYDRGSVDGPMGPDGCIDMDHPTNAGLPEDVWCDNCTLTSLYRNKYSHLSRADFWIASANAVIRQTSVDTALDMRNTFVWGRKDVNTCAGSGERLPLPSGCGQVEGVFLERMGLTWVDAVALMGAHTLGRGAGKVREAVF